MNLRELLEATPGRRFTERYRQNRHAGPAWRKPLSMIAGAMLILLGVLLTLTPGPGQAWRKLKRRASRPSGPA
ncbi:MAG TPA: hypothetical protein VEU32_18490 [Burkholderiales bacterium]|nr:hypothetical protein [Burkholderiales bacterium]